MRQLAALTTAAVLLGSCGGGTTAGTSTTTSSSPASTAPTPTASMPTGSSGWEVLPSMPTPRSELPAVVLGGEIYAVGGYAANERGRFRASAVVEAYDPATRSWRRVADLPSPRHHAMGAAYGGRLFVFGGFNRGGNPTATAWSYDTDADAWASVARMPRGTGAGAAVTAGDFIYVIGGVPKGRSVYRYDPQGDEWTEMARLNEPSEHVAAAALDGAIYVVAGRWNGRETARVEVYDVAADEWRPTEPVQVARGGFGAAAWTGKIVIAGGELVSARDQLDSVELFDPMTGLWVFGPTMPGAVHGNGVTAYGDDLYVVGGSSIATDVVNRGDLWVLRGANP